MTEYSCSRAIHSPSVPVAAPVAAADPLVLKLGTIENLRSLNPYQAAELGYIDAVIEPAETRWQIANALRATQHKREALPAKKHGNIPL